MLPVSIDSSVSKSISKLFCMRKHYFFITFVINIWFNMSNVEFNSFVKKEHEKNIFSDAKSLTNRLTKRKVDRHW